MKLIACYIENYGKIKQQDFSFVDGVTAFCQENGEGKTTLASFIKAMFYGLDGYTVSTKEFCDRKHFYPFDANGSRFGGNLTFEKDGKIYRIERFFGEKSATADSCLVYCNGELTEEFGADIGKAVFGIDRASFERTAFVTDADIEIAATSDITAKLNQFLQGGEEENGYDAAMEKLQKAAKNYKKVRGGNDYISLEKAKIDGYQTQIDNVQSIRAALETKYEKYTALGEQIATTEMRVAAIQKQNENFIRYDTYQSYVKEAERYQKAAETLAVRYPLGVPLEEENARASELLEQNKLYEAQKDNGAFTQQDGYRLDRLCEKFIKGVPDEQTLTEVRKKADALRDISVPAVELKKVKARGLFYAAFIFLLGVGSIVLGLFNWILAFAVAGVGMLAFVAVAFTAALSQTKQHKESYQKNIQRVDLEKELQFFFQGYGFITPDYYGNLADLRSQIREYYELKNRLDQARKVQRELTEKIEKNKAEIEAYVHKYRLVGLTPKQIDADIKEHARLQTEIVRKRAQAEEYRVQNGLQGKPDGERTSVDELNFVLNNLRREYSLLQRQIVDDETQAGEDKLAELYADKEQAEECLKAYKRNHNLLSAAAMLLEQAEGNLKERYVKPIKDEFLVYANALEKALGEKVTMTKNFEIRFERNGVERSEKHLSSGQRSICALCFRLALLKTMYKEQKPFIIFDDPFTALDKTHMEKVKGLIADLALDMQIVYFTCHESRML